MLHAAIRLIQTNPDESYRRKIEFWQLNFAFFRVSMLLRNFLRDVYTLRLFFTKLHKKFCSFFL